MYRIRDLQFECRYFADGEIFETKKEILDQLVDYHNIDFSGTDDKDNELTIDQFFKFWKIKGLENQLQWILEYGEWEIEEVKGEE